MHELIHEERHNASLKIVLFLNRVGNFTNLLLWFNCEVSVNDVQYILINLEDYLAIALLQNLISVSFLHYFN